MQRTAQEEPIVQGQKPLPAVMRDDQVTSEIPMATLYQ